MTALETPDVSATPAPEKPRPQPRVRAAIGILVSRFPHLDQTYLLREINELERQGQPVVLIPLLREDSEVVLDDSEVVLEEAAPWLRRALYLPLFSAGIARANVARLLRHPIQYVRLLLRLILGTLVRPRTLIGTLALFPKSVYLADALPRLGLKHIHAHFGTHTTTMAYIIASLSDVTFSFTVHGPDVFVHQLLLADKLAKAKFVRAVSTFNKAFLSGLFPTLARDKIEVVHMGLSPDVYAHPSAESAKSARMRLLSVAKLVPSEGFPYLIDACERLIGDGVDVDCTIVGQGGPQYRKTEESIARRGLSERVHLLGPVSQDEVAKLMGDCDVFVLPSVIAHDGQMDGIPTSLMEAMAADRPIVASALSGIPELVEDGVSGLLVDATQPDRVAAALRQLAEDSALRERMGHAGQQKVRHEFDVRVTAAAFLALLDRQQQPRTTTAERVAQLDWDQLNICAIGVRRIVERRDSIVADVAVTDGISKRDVIVKLHGDLDRARYAYDVLRTLRPDMTATLTDASSTIVYTVPRALMIDEPHAAVITERAPGETLESMLRRKGTTPVTSLRRAGTWLRLMQAQTRVDEDGRHILTATVFLALRDLDLAAAGDQTLLRHRQAISDRLRTLESLVADRPLPVVGYHGDFSPANVFISEGRVVVVNVDDFREGLPLGDVASFLLRLETRFRRYRDAGAAFLAGYTDASLDPSSLTLFRMASALQLLARSADGVTPSGAARRLLIEEIVGGPR